jgi:hypothetical protein
MLLVADIGIDCPLADADPVITSVACRAEAPLKVVAEGAPIVRLPLPVIGVFGTGLARVELLTQPVIVKF